MSNRYLLPCPVENCAENLEVETRQAGGNIPCPKCSSAVQVPTLRDLKKLAPADGHQAESTLSVPNPLKAKFFAIGLAIAAIAGGSGWALYNYADNMVEVTNVDTNSIAEMVNEPVADATPVELWDTWYNLLDGETLPDWQQADWNRYNSQGKILKNLAYGLIGVAGFGVLMLFSSFFIPNKKE